MNAQTERTQAFYDQYWPKNVPDFRKTRAHVRSIVPPSHYRRALDGGCGTGVCSLALAEVADEAVGFDLSSGSLNTARALARKLGVTNLTFEQGSLLQLPFASNSFDLVLAGVSFITPLTRSALWTSWYAFWSRAVRWSWLFTLKRR
jgi:ubiquinone/menaquinone biosynthesis C-methylase UbiE